MEEIIQIQDKFYILASSSPANEETRVLKNGDTFALFDRHGDMRPLGFEDHGMYHEGTRFLSRFVFRLEGKNPLLLNSAVKEDNDFLLVHVTNPDIKKSSGEFILKGTLYLRRSIFLLSGSCHQRIQMINFGTVPHEFSFSFLFDADYSDIFEIRGMKRERRGSRLPHDCQGRDVELAYRGLDGVARRTSLRFSHEPMLCKPSEAHFSVKLAPHEEATYTVAAHCSYNDNIVSFRGFDQAYDQFKLEDRILHEQQCGIVTSNESFNSWMNRSRADIYMMLTHTSQGLYPYAGIPWYSTVFGRDGIITALETLWVNPEIARGVLNYLATHQAGEVIPEQDAEPGKILHEQRKGEMAALKEIPFGNYYGTIDATPLFVILAGYYYERTGDKAFIEYLWPAIEQAAFWMDRYGDRDGDGFVEYERSSGKGLANQGWKDSEDSVFHKDGTFAPAPIALCEVQGYVYEAKRKAGMLAYALGRKKKAVTLCREADALKEHFLSAFWCDDIGMYAIALDGSKNPCRVRSSNAGHTLFTGIASKEHAASIVRAYQGEDFFCGWGIRTIAAGEARYNPLSYHNGSVWPHDNALIAFGMARYGHKDAAMKVLTGLFDASGFMSLRRLPELFCGFKRHSNEGPTLYPVACDPQAWAAGSPFLLLQSCLGLSIQAQENKVYFHNPKLPYFLKEVTLKNLRVGASVLDVTLITHDNDVGVNIKQKEGDVEVIITK